MPYTEGAGGRFSQVELDAASFKNVPDISIDYALMEKAHKIAAVTCEIGWSDIGSWTAIGDLVEADPSGNRVVGEALLHNVANW